MLTAAERQIASYVVSLRHKQDCVSFQLKSSIIFEVFFEVISKLISLKLSEYDKISDELCRMNDTGGNIAGYLHETYHKLFKQGQPQITDFLQTAEQRQGMDAIDKFAKSKAKYPLLGMQLNDFRTYT